MDRYKFRGKRVDNGEWVYGWYIKGGSDHVDYIIPHPVTIHHLRQNNFQPTIIQMVTVHPDTVGQYIGEHDKDETEICVGDKIDHFGRFYEVVYANGAYYKMRSLWEECPDWQKQSLDFCETDQSELEVIGTIHDKRQKND